MFPTGMHLLQGEEMVPNELSPLHAKAVDVRDSVPNSPAIQYTLTCPYYWVVGLKAWHCSGSEAPLCHHYVLSLTHRGILSLIHRQSTCPPGDFAGIEILGRGHVIQTCSWLPQMFVAAAFGAKLWSCEYRQVVESGYVCARVRALVNHLGFAIEITYTPMHNIIIYIYVHNMCLWFFPCISTTSSHATWSLQFFWVEKKQIFPSKRRSGRSCSWTHGILPAILVTLGHLGSPWVTLGHHHHDLEFSMVSISSIHHPNSSYTSLAGRTWHLSVIQNWWPLQWSWRRFDFRQVKMDRWARKVQRRQREIWMFGTVEGHDSSWCFKIVSLALAWVRLAAELFMVSIKVLSTSKQKFTPKARCVQSTVLAEPREDAGGGWFCWPKFFHDRFRAKYVASETQANVLLLDLASSGNTSVELCKEDLEDDKVEDCISEHSYLNCLLRYIISHHIMMC